MTSRKRYAVVGTGGRSALFIDALAGVHREHGELAGFCDRSPTRMAYYNRRLEERHRHPPVPAYRAEDFDRMIRETRPDAVIVTTPDATHHTYIIRAMELGRDAISEKPMTTDAAKTGAIFDAIRRTGRRLRVTFNCRYAPNHTEVCRLLRAGAVGRPLAVDLSWSLDTRHGADYFRRWHAEKRYSGGLLIHKASHHFDLVNWWLDSYPERVFALGELKFYGKKNAEARGDGRLAGYPRYTGHPEAEGDPFALTLDGDPDLRGLYLDAEADSGYLRDENVFSGRITIEDTMAITARYRNGALFNYSLVAYAPWEGYRVVVTGDRGRLELFVRQGSHIIAGQSDEELARIQALDGAQTLTVHPMFGTPHAMDIPAAEGGHGGGDPVLLEHLFSPTPPADPYGRAATHVDGAAAMLMGAAANESIRTGQPVTVDELLKLDAPVR